MPTILTSGGQNLIKNSCASAPSLDLTLICNGEEPTSIFDSLGNILIAGIDKPTVAPTVVDGGSGGVGIVGYVAYRYVYAATRRYPFVENITAAGGSVAPRSNPSVSSTPFLITALHKQTITVTKTQRSDIDKIWIYRTETFSTALLTAEASEAGQLFFLASINNDGNPGTATYTDNTDVVGGEQLEFDNFPAPTSAFCVFYEPYFYLFGNLPLVVAVTITYSTVGPVTTITLTDTTILKWFKGRNKQFIKFAEVSTGGFDGFGTFYFRWLSDTTAQLVTNTEANTNGYISLLGTTTATIFGYSTTLYRSKANNPFGWGKTVTVGSLAIPELYTLKVGGGIGTGIAVLPSDAILKLDTENPAKCYSLNLKLQDDEDFESTLRILSDTYSTSINSTQFPTLNRNKNASVCSLDSKNYSILECNGAQQIPISDAVVKFLRTIDVSEAAQRNYHGVFDPYTECNFVWLREEGALPIITHCVYQHMPTGQWGMMLDFDITASSSLQDATTNETLILGGTDTGIFGRLLKPFKFVNWLADPTSTKPCGYKIFASSTNQHTLILAREIPMEMAEDLTDVKIYFLNALGAQKSIFLYYNINASSAPAGSVGFDYILSIVTAVGDSVTTILNTITTAIANVISASDLGLAQAAGINEILLQSISGTVTNSVSESYNTTITASPYDEHLQVQRTVFGQTFLITSEAIGRWMLAELPNNQSIWLRIVFTFNALAYFDSYYGDITLLNTTIVGDGFLTLFIGLNQCRFQKHFDLNAITKRKTLKEIWIAASLALNKILGTSSNFYYNSKILIGFNDQLNEEPETLILPKQDIDGAGVVRDMFFITPKQIPSNPFKTFGITVIQRGYTDHKIYNMALKMTT